ncbi:unnamed protein product [Agarophyton chilense]
MSFKACELSFLRLEDEEKAVKCFRSDVIEGLCRKEKALSSTYFYDTVGSDLYAKITELEEYYLTGCEMEIFKTQAKDIIDNHLKDLGKLSQTINVVDLGAGDGGKTKVLLQALVQANLNFQYIPIDISQRSMELLFKSFSHHFTETPIDIHGVVGNFSEAGEVEFLSTIKNSLNPGDLFMLGTDLRKDPRVTLQAYSDSLGVTREFNLNLLTRMNRELNMDFDRSKFIHYASYDPTKEAALSFLISTEAQTVSMKLDNASGGKGGHQNFEFQFEAYEAIHTETSRKYTVTSIHEKLESVGFEIEGTYYDSHCWFADSVAAVR